MLEFQAGGCEETIKPVVLILMNVNRKCSLYDFEDIAKVTTHLIEKAELKGFGLNPWTLPTIIIPNNDRSVASVIKRLKDDIRFRLHADGANYVSSEPIDRTLCFYLNNAHDLQNTYFEK